jgi:hypothetical protein
MYRITVFNERLLRNRDEIGHFRNLLQVHERSMNGLNANYEKYNTIIYTWIRHRF